MTASPPTPTRVLFVSHTDQFSGAEAVLADLVDHAVARGDRVTVAAPHGVLSGRLPAGVDHLPLPMTGLKGGRGVSRIMALAGLGAAWLRAAATLRSLVVDRDVAVVVNSTMVLPAVRLAAPLRSGTCTWLVHDTIRERKQRAVVGFAARAVRRAVAVSDATADSLSGFAFPISVRVNGTRIGPEPSRNPADDPPIIGMLGTLTPWKGQDVLLAAVADLPDVDVELAGTAMPGDEEYVAHLDRLAAQAPLAGRVRRLGHADSARCLQRWTVLVSASTLPEAGPLGAIEAMAAGCPVVGVRGSGYVTDDRPCVVVPPGDPAALAAALRRVLDDPALRDGLAAAGRRLVAAEHDRERTLPAMYEELIAQ